MFISHRVHLMVVFLLLFQRHAYTQQQALIINEIMARPALGALPNYEYIELLNIGQHTENLSQYSFTIANTTQVLPEYLLAPNQYILLCSKTAEPYLTKYGNVLGLPKWPALTNTGTTISLQSAHGMDQVSYTDKWYKNPTKKAGGWSLERINANFPCNFELTWIASNSSSGGSPCKPNSVSNPSFVPVLDILSKEILRDTLFLTINIPKTLLQGLQKEVFSLDNRVGTPTEIKWKNESDTIGLIFSKPLSKAADYTLTLSPFLWCGNYSTTQQHQVFQQGEISFNDIIINEILFNPHEGGVDFVELYNRSNQIINLQQWELGNRIITTIPLLLRPQEYLVLTTNKANILQNYPSAAAHNIREITSLPPYPNEQGNVTLFYDNKLVDSLYYHSKMHAPMLNSVKGQSLERRSFDEATNSPHNFVSASSIHGGATPGYKNSTIVDNFFKKNNLYLSSKTISPDDDNFEDNLEINYMFNREDLLLNLTIYNDAGRQINRLIRNQRTGSSGKIIWDGRQENGQLSPTGFYLYRAETYDPLGYYEVYSESFVLTYKSTGY